ncbi:AgmX/PglI C-terminal domain-containing protein [Marinobacter fonticola]|uniref:AgmX/PglI C-terminal domain-containing protein n=1 Tax=Marinobacter fonticola TaxID=2603215 RepID=UPI001D0DB4AF|nr:AgmX/PglI C-terminal domain-containing protein [Marinobacter fonticola]
MLIFLPLAVFIPTIDLPEPERQTQEQIPPQLARLIEKQPEPEPAPEPEPIPEVDPQPEPESRPEPTPQPVAEPESPEPAQQQSVQEARDVASRSGLMALQDELSSMQSMTDSESSSRMSANVEDDAAEPSAQREDEQSDVLAGSDGVNDVDGPQEAVDLAQHDVKAVEAPEQRTTPEPQEAAQPKGPGERSMANIRRVFDQQKSALFSLYNRELRRNPALAGEVLLELTIEPDGRVSDCRIVSSELEAPTLEQKIVDRVRLFNFGAADVEQRQVRFPIDFLPS